MQKPNQLPALRLWDRTRTGYSLTRPTAGTLLITASASEWRLTVCPMKPTPTVGNALGRGQWLATATTVVELLEIANGHFALSGFRTNSKVGSLPLHDEQTLAAHFVACLALQYA